MIEMRLHKWFIWRDKWDRSSVLDCLSFLRYHNYVKDTKFLILLYTLQLLFIPLKQITIHKLILDYYTIMKLLIDAGHRMPSWPWPTSNWKQTERVMVFRNLIRQTQGFIGTNPKFSKGALDLSWKENANFIFFYVPKYVEWLMVFTALT